jgi:S-adenosylmethionine:tRNA ribosyltransferase-isomerase
VQLQDFTYQLPKDRIASKPPQKRGDAKLLVLDQKTGKVSDRKYRDVVDYLYEGDVVVLNNTKVIKARLYVSGSSGEQVELVLVEQHGKHDDWHRHKVLYRGKLKSGDELILASNQIIVREIVGEGLAMIESKTDLMKLAEKYGSVPLPPYMKRQATVDDVARYQTEFARSSGSVAAPTASLNMTKDTINKLRHKGVIVVDLTLHVGLGTFLPIRVDDLTKQLHVLLNTLPMPF